MIVTTGQAAIIEGRGRLRELVDLEEGHVLVQIPDGRWKLTSGELVEWQGEKGTGCGCGGEGRESQVTAEREMA